MTPPSIKIIAPIHKAIVLSIAPATGISVVAGAEMSAGMSAPMCKVKDWEPAEEVKETVWSPSVNVVVVIAQFPALSVVAVWSTPSIFIVTCESAVATPDKIGLALVYHHSEETAPVTLIAPIDFN